MATVYNTVKDSAGNLLTGQVVIDLVIFSGDAVSFQGFVDLSNVTTDYTINTATTLTLSNGQWQATLRGNAAINDAYGSTVTTYYKISEISNGVTRVYYIQVPNDNNSYWAGDLVAATPVPSSSGYTLDSLTDVVASGAADGMIIQFSTTDNLWHAVTIPALTGASSKSIIQFGAPGILQPVTGTMAQFIPYTFTIAGVYLHVGTAPVGGSIICDVKLDGVSIYANTAHRPTIASGSQTSTGGVPSGADTTSGTNKVLSIDILQTGATLTEGSDLTVSVGVTYA